MYSKFPFSMENLPRHREFGCLSLKFGCIVTALVVILYTMLALAQLSVDLMAFAAELKANDVEMMLNFAAVVTMLVVHSVSFLLTVVMLLGALKEKAELIRPWVMWKSLQLLIAVLIFVFLNTLVMISQHAEASMLLYALTFLSLLIRFYMLVLVASYYRQLTEDREETEKLRSLINETWYTEA